MARPVSEAAVERLWHEHAAALLGFLAYQCGDRALAEDVLADTFERVMTTRRPWRPGAGSERTWLYAIALNRLRDLKRRSGAEERALERVDPTGPAPVTADVVGDREALRSALAHLPDDQRQAIALRYGAALSITEVAEVCGEPVTTIDARLRRGLKAMRGEIG